MILSRLAVSAKASGQGTLKQTLKPVLSSAIRFVGREVSWYKLECREEMK